MIRSAKNPGRETVVIKGVRGHPRVENERDALRRFQDRTPYLRPLLDEIEEPRDPLTIVLKYFKDPLLNLSIKKTLNRKGVKFVSKRILEALKVLHEDGYVHTGKDSTRHSSDDPLNLMSKMSSLTTSL
jgi:serine/threonine protein kinase